MSGREPARRAGSVPVNGQNCSILFTDIVGFSAPVRDDQDRAIVRTLMYEILREGLEASGVPWADLHQEDRGDGALLVAPPSVPTLALVDPLLSRMTARLRRHNRRAGEPVRVRLRVALHVGPVHPDPHGVCGHAVNHTARLLDSPEFRAAMESSGSDLGFITSPFVHEFVAGHASGEIRPEDYRRVEVRVKETTATAWVYLSPAEPPRARPREAVSPAQGVSFHGEVHVAGDLVLGDKLGYLPDGR